MTVPASTPTETSTHALAHAFAAGTSLAPLPSSVAAVLATAAARRRTSRRRAPGRNEPPAQVGLVEGLGRLRREDGHRQRVDQPEGPARKPPRVVVRAGAAQRSGGSVRRARRQLRPDHPARLRRGRVGRHRPRRKHLQRDEELRVDDGRTGVRPEDDPRPQRPGAQLHATRRGAQGCTGRRRAAGDGSA